MVTTPKPLIGESFSFRQTPNTLRVSVTNSESAWEFELSLRVFGKSQYKEISTKYPTGLVFCDSNLSDGGYRDVVNAVRHLGSQAQVVITSGRDGWPEFIEAMRAGAFLDDIILVPCRPKMWNGW